jgi:hypothetical protein
MRKILFISDIFKFESLKTRLSILACFIALSSVQSQKLDSTIESNNYIQSYEILSDPYSIQTVYIINPLVLSNFNIKEIITKSAYLNELNLNFYFRSHKNNDFNHFKNFGLEFKVGQIKCEPNFSTRRFEMSGNIKRIIPFLRPLNVPFILYAFTPSMYNPVKYWRNNSSSRSAPSFRVGLVIKYSEIN